MMSFRVFALVVLTAIALQSAIGVAAAQSSDAAAERSRLGDERIRAETERREQEELERLAAAEAQAAALAEPAATSVATSVAMSDPAAAPVVAPAAEPTTATTAVPGPAASSAGNAGISQALEQLRELGELHDAGYVTDEEFEQIKERILSGF